MKEFILGVESTIIVIIIVYIVSALICKAIKSYAVALYKEGYNKSQVDDTTQLLAILKQIPYEYGNFVWKALTKTELEVPKSEEVEKQKEPIGFHK